MEIEETLLALSPLDGRYQVQTGQLRPYFSEYAFLKYRVIVEVRYLLHLSTLHVIRDITKKERLVLEEIIDSFLLKEASRIKVFERETKHDVKAVEYFLKEKLTDTSLADLLPYVHFGLTSEDVNNLAYGMMLTDAHHAVILPQLKEVLSGIKIHIRESANMAMLALTHGQPAVPTTFGKELSVFYVRLTSMFTKLKKIRFAGKLNGAVGTWSALSFTHPHVDWVESSKRFIASLDLEPCLFTTQIMHADTLNEYFWLLMNTNTIFLGLSIDLWQYISRGIVMQAVDVHQVGSSTMPQKVNPIHFENAEGNLQVANALFELYQRKLGVSRMQRDLSDSTVKRTIGTAVGHTLLAWKSIENGLDKIQFHSGAAFAELDAHWEVLAEAIQVYMKVHGDEQGYEKVKKITRGKKLDEKTYRQLVKGYPTLARLTPAVYIGLAKKIAELAIK